MTQELFENKLSGAQFSPCGKYRYALWRIWDESLPKIMFIGLNPSTATADMDDPTIRRVKRFAKDWGYGGVYMANLFAFFSPYPEDLLTCEDPVGKNDFALKLIKIECEDVLFAWGSFKQAKERAVVVSAMFPDALCLGVTKDNSPKHPLYIAANTKPVQFSNPQSITTNW